LWFSQHIEAAPAVRGEHGACAEWWQLTNQPTCFDAISFELSGNRYLPLGADGKAPCVANAFNGLKVRAPEL
jgi:hypothetical protein